VLEASEGLLAIIVVALDPRTLASLRQPSFHHHLVDLELCCAIDRGLSIDVDRRGEANVEQEHDCYTSNGENASSIITIARPFTKYAWSAALIRIDSRQGLGDITLGGLSVKLNSSGERKPTKDALSSGSYLDRQVRRQGCRDRDDLVTWLRDVGLALSRCRGGCDVANSSQGFDLGSNNW